MAALRQFNLLVLATFSLTLVACGSGGDGNSSVSSSSSSSSSSVSTTERIKLNQIGYLPAAQKVAIVPDVAATAFTLVNQAGEVVYNGNLPAAQTWAPAEESVKIADFSDFSTPGAYYITVEGVQNSDGFSISDTVYSDVHDAAIKAYYFNRSSSELQAQHAGDWARAAGHPDTNVLVHGSAVSAERPEGTSISSSKGWYDAGDYNKYIVNSGISTYTLLAAYEHFPAFYADREWNIPESGGDLPDLLDEVLWNLDWMETMQDPNDGGVYHKLTTLSFSGGVMPAAATAQRYVVAKGTSATLNFAAVMATASRVFKPIDSSKAAAYLAAAERAWDWAIANPEKAFTNPSDVKTGEYGDGELNDEFAWAAAELFISTQEASYLAEFQKRNAASGVPSWGYVSPLAYISLVQHAETMVGSDDYSSFQSSLVSTADELESLYRSSAYRVSMQVSNFGWGSNSDALNQAMMLVQAWRITGEQKYRDAALGLVDYALGKNPTDYSYVTGYGARPPMGIHHRQSHADSVDAPVPGFLSGGPNPGQQDGCNYTSNVPAKSFVDDWCSYASNEVTINWNAPLVYVLAAVQAM
ncbi:glycoside hydrolase family 9 protein [Teredinibacter haidensis]|uniref:glycoside hydrolase family 9 protein n=1 Tax=Teredinibacter haidensis TaxID=2731755 RepID=UPI000948AF43|nr:glycoside hydrolase family 9 protein [Teredinibacter haidensis]